VTRERQPRTRRTTIYLASMPYRTAREAIDACQEGERAISLDGMYLVMDRESADALGAEGTEFAYLVYLTRSDGKRVVATVPVN
jgi:hypothetical protein